MKKFYSSYALKRFSPGEPEKLKTQPGSKRGRVSSDLQDRLTEEGE